MSCKYNNSLYSTEVPEFESYDDHIIEILNDPYDEIIDDYRKFKEYEEAGVFIVTEEEMFCFAEAMREHYQKRGVSL